ncbi:Endoribonuclease Dicer homolog 1-like protein [Drosera capensis]
MECDRKQEYEGKTDKKIEVGRKARIPEERARQYQLDVLEQAKQKNTIAFLETGAGKTLIAILLVKQAEVIRAQTGYSVGHYCGEMGQDFLGLEKVATRVLVMTAQILLNILRHSIIKMEYIDLLILDECHHAVKKHPY